MPGPREPSEAPQIDRRAPYFFKRQDARSFAPSPLVEGVWNRAEQHIAPSLGLMTHAIEMDLKRRRGDSLVLARLSFDLLGTIPIGPVTIDIGTLRPGRTIELVEARLSYEGRVCVIARAWLLQCYDTATIAGSSFPPLPAPEALPAWGGDAVWGGACIGAIEIRRTEIEPGRAQAWLRTGVALIDGEAVSDTARAMGLVDIANGVAARMPPEAVLFPNVDLTVHLFRGPSGGWLGLDTTVSFGMAGIGLTHSILHDVRGVIGTVAQCLTVRPR